MEYLLEVVQDLSLAHDLERVMEIVRHAARALTGADGATFVLRDGDNCYYAEEDAIQPLWKGSRFPIRTCISGWVMTNRAPVVIEDIFTDPRIPLDAYRPTFVRSLAMVPIRSLDPVGAIGNYWARHYRPTAEQVKILQALANTTAVALESVQLYGKLESRVKERTAELEMANEKIQRLSLTDDLTGLYNRRGFTLLASQEMRAMRRNGLTGWLLFADLDGLKRANDRFGHERGDQLLRAAARTMRETFREEDVVARLGGDEYVVFGIGDEAPTGVDSRLQSAIDIYNMDSGGEEKLSVSTGVVRCDLACNATLENLMARADEAMYEVKRRRTAR